MDGQQLLQVSGQLDVPLGAWCLGYTLFVDFAQYTSLLVTGLYTALPLLAV